MEPAGKLKPLSALLAKGKPTAPQDSIHIVPKKFGPFTLKANGVFHFKGDDDDTKEEFICSPLEVIARSRAEGGQEWGFVLRWNDPDGRIHIWSAPADLTITNGTELGQALASGGLTIAPGKSTQLRKYIVAVNPAKKIPMRNISRLWVDM